LPTRLELPKTPTIFELREYETPEAGHRLATVLLDAHDMGGPMLVPLNKRGDEFDPMAGDELEKLVKD
jgi:hypothetical protein